MLLKFSDRYELVCDVCKASETIATTDFPKAHREASVRKWQERVRRGGATRSHWACPKCKDATKRETSLGHTSSVHGDISGRKTK